ncbi:Crp/Fnr family transcriptional regulator [Marinobacterium arenosum]|uniref:Crp/Fnr family transcriptional regulator n=1 Tax=Marinobacterium arenosum TaxID=2862496 RepID=UPI001C946B59|nr:Crp/Fnr family transcriptional regulator [Marinobacterium arenosum]MBY4677418.1 Crp/Fnr family transcriptional regulator [Marinobacterium arenosum]
MDKQQLQQGFFDYFQKLSGLAQPVDWFQLQLNAEVRHYRKGDYLFRQGEQAARLFFLATGLVRYISVDSEGKAFTQAFYAAPALAGSTRAMVRGTPALFSIELLEDALVLEFDWTLFFEQMKHCPRFLQGYVRILEAMFIQKEERENSLARQSAEQRYLQFLEQQPDLAERIPLQYIACYIGITPVALSRIRSRLK